MAAADGVQPFIRDTWISSQPKKMLLKASLQTLVLVGPPGLDVHIKDL